MAKIVLGIGASHSPLMALKGKRWAERAADDRRNQRLNTPDGRYVSYDQLSAETGSPWEADATEERFLALEVASQTALDRLASELEAAAPDVVLIVGDDQGELFSAANMPALGVFYGAEVVMHPRKITDATPAWVRTVSKQYAMDAAHVFPGSPDVARAISAGLIDLEFDVGAYSRVDRPEELGFGHAYGFIIARLFRGRSIPVVPVLLNTYFPPNVPTPKRCYDLGRALREVVSAYPGDARVAVAASGGLSHFVVDEELDRGIVAAIRTDDNAALGRLPAHKLIAGSSEILNWVVAAGMVEGLANKWIDYYPIRRTPAGTGIGVAFSVWG
jgi:hypothetical protein